MNHIFNLTEKVSTDDSIEQYEYFGYEPITGANLNHPGSIRINIESQDIFTHPSKSFLYVEGRLTKADGTAYADTDLVTLVNNGIMNLFSEIRYYLSEKEIESLLYPGQASTMLGLLKFPDDFSKSMGLQQLWYKDTDTTASLENIGFKIRHGFLIKSPTAKGTFSFAIPLSHMFGFCEDYTKVVYGFKHALTLVRKANDDAIFKAAAAGEGKVTLTKLVWYMPHVIPSDTTKFETYKVIEEKETLSVPYRMRQCESINVAPSTHLSWRLGVKSAPEKPRYIIIGFQTDKQNDQDKNSAVFDHVHVKNMYIMLNAQKYPATDYDLSFENNQFMRMYHDTAAFRSKVYGMDELISNPNITPSDFKTLYPLFCFDVSKQSEKLKTSVIDLQVKASFTQNVPENTNAFALVISDRILSFKSDGQKLNVVY